MESIFFTGAGGQGKTTTAELLSPKIELPIVDGLSRNNPYTMGTDEAQNWLAEAVFNECINPEPRIHCRTPLDVLAYSAAYEKGDLQIGLDEVSHFLRKKPKIVYFPYYFEVEEDGFRPTDATLAKQVNKAIFDMLFQYSMRNSDKILILLNEPPEPRVQEILSFLSYN